MTRKRISREEILQDIQAVAIVLGRAPKRSEYNKLGKYSGDYIADFRFRGWNEAITAAGLTPSHRTPRSRKKVKCEHCGQKTTNHRFCSHSCRAIVTNSERGEAAAKRRKCKICGEEVSFRSKFCSNTCRWERSKQRTVNQWLSGEIDGGVGRNNSQLRKAVREYMIQNAGNKCEVCGWCVPHPITGEPPLTIHHVDGNASNNRPQNLQCLCHNCHALTNTYCGRNRGNGRNSTANKSDI